MTNRETDKAIVVPVSKVKTKSGKDFFDSDIDSEQMEAAVDTLTASDDLGKDIRIVDGRVLIKFPKFVHLIVMHNFEDVMEKHADEDIVISSELLVDLANAHEESEQKVPWFHLLAAALIGVVLTIMVMQTL